MSDSSAILHVSQHSFMNHFYIDGLTKYMHLYPQMEIIICHSWH